ncbi:sensor histidine kinase [Actinocorallia longicatena]|uniref:histidine kinase n=1 Tax=Actinocorallia longicatena TaxID=111803 RepID=A0ABP6QID1_9ACTN
MAHLHTIRSRIALVLAVPTALLVVVALLGVAAQFRVARDAEETAQNVELVLTAQELVHSLQKERGYSVGLTGGESSYRTPLDRQRKTSDAARTALGDLLAGAPSTAAGRIRKAGDGLTPLSSVREAVDARKASKAEISTFFSTSIGALNDAMFAADVGQGDAELRQGLAALRALSVAKEFSGRERATLNGVFASGRFTHAEYEQFSELRADRRSALAEFHRLAAVPEWTRALDATLRTPQAVTMLGLEEHALDGPGSRRLGVEPETWWNASTAYIDDLHRVQLSVGSGIKNRAEAVIDASHMTLFRYFGALAVLLLAAAGLGYVTFRAIVRPLRRLTREAMEAAEYRLPEAVARIQAAEDPAGITLDLGPHRARRRADEFTAVADALDHLQECAVRLAIEQAVMRRNASESLANLGRRNQNLVRRQLGFISALEKEEADPNELANLFELDHLATRMRRNAESLLVLVGEHSPRRWSGPIPLGDVLRSALAEVEDYRRVVLRRIDEGMVRGAVAAELSHLLAELIENALTFSPPDQEVELSARTAGDEVHIAIVDAGIGMRPEALEAANAKLRGERSFLVQPTRDLGHFVVGRLAERLGVRVRLHDSPLNGITARVTLGGAVMEEPSAPRHRAPRPAPARPRPVAEPAARTTEPPAGDEAGMQRTRIEPAFGGTTANGLARRGTRDGGEQRARRPEQRRSAPAPVGRTPGEVSMMLTAFRSGYQSAAPEPATPDGPDPRKRHGEGKERP